MKTQNNVRMGGIALAMLVAATLLFCPAPAMATIAYDVSAGSVGNDTFGGSLGLDFHVNSPINVTALGAFDSSQNGISGTVNVTIFDRNTTLQVIAPTAFSGACALTGGSCFTATAFSLPVGDYSVVAWGYNTSEPFGNQGVASPPPLSTMNDGGGLISFQGLGRYDGTAGNYPATADFGPANRYDAGTFQFEAPSNGVPEPSTLLLLGSSLVGLSGLAWRRQRRG